MRLNEFEDLNGSLRGREAEMSYPANLAVGRQIKVNYLWAFTVTFADFKGKSWQDSRRKM